MAESGGWKRKRGRVHPVWEFFIVRPDSFDCTLCVDKTLKGNNSTNAIKHLRCAHPEKYHDMIAKNNLTDLSHTIGDCWKKKPTPMLDAIAQASVEAFSELAPTLCVNEQLRAMYYSSNPSLSTNVASGHPDSGIITNGSNGTVSNGCVGERLEDILLSNANNNDEGESQNTTQGFMVCKQEVVSVDDNNDSNGETLHREDLVRRDVVCINVMAGGSNEQSMSNDKSVQNTSDSDHSSNVVNSNEYNSLNVDGSERSVIRTAQLAESSKCRRSDADRIGCRREERASVTYKCGSCRALCCRQPSKVRLMTKEEPSQTSRSAFEMNGGNPTGSMPSKRTFLTVEANRLVQLLKWCPNCGSIVKYVDLWHEDAAPKLVWECSGDCGISEWTGL